VYWPNYYKGQHGKYQAQRGSEEIALPINKLSGIWGWGRRGVNAKPRLLYQGKEPQ